MYAVVGPELTGIYHSMSEINNMLCLYPYLKFRRFETEDECYAFINRYKIKHTLDEITKFGDTFKRACIDMSYYIGDAIYYNFDTSSLGIVKIVNSDANIHVGNRQKLIKAKIEGISADNDLISGHMVAIYHGLKLVGDFVDVNITVPDHSIYYALRSYTGDNRVIKRVKTLIDKRQGKISVTLKKRGETEEWNEI